MVGPLHSSQDDISVGLGGSYRSSLIATCNGGGSLVDTPSSLLMLLLLE